VSNAFEIMGVAVVLGLSEEELREKFREAGKRLHPDAGGAEGDFAALREAYALLSSPAQRLRLWLELRGAAGEIRGSIDTGLMDLFSEVGTATQRAEALIRKREDAKSALAKALLEHETHSCREAVAALISNVEGKIAAECADFPEFEKAAEIDAELAWQHVRSLTFLEKWKTSLRSSFARIA
jgi:curved DNA-binding protein CbpA